MSFTTSIHILVPRINARLNYIFSELFERRLQWKVKAYTNQETFSSAKGYKLIYDEVFRMPNVPYIVPSQLLFEKRVQAQEVNPTSENGLLAIFRNKTPVLTFDVFAAVFYHLSRYEEYFPHRYDEHGRFNEEDSILVQHEVAQIPQVERYAQELLSYLQSYYKELPGPVGSFERIISMDVDQLYQLKHKGLTRTAAGLLSDFIMGRGGHRISVLTGVKEDPNDIYDAFIHLCRSHDLRPIFFIQVGENSRFDINNPPHLSAIRSKINAMAMQVDVGLHPSYFTSEQPELFSFESERLRSIVSFPIESSRQHYMRLNLPDTFRHLQENGVKKDYSMAYVRSNGFRAGTCMPFRFYDLEREDVLDIELYPTAFMDITSVRNNLRSNEALEELITLDKTVKQYNGKMVTTWHPEVLSGTDVPFSSLPIFEAYLQHA